MESIIKDMCERAKKYNFLEIQDYLIFMIGFLETFEDLKDLKEILDNMRKLL